MADEAGLLALTRRRLLQAAAALPAVVAASSRPATADAGDAAPTAHFKDELTALLAGRTPVEAGVAVELPEIAENGNFVPISILVDSPMTPDDYVKSIYVLSSGNPVAKVAIFHLSPLNALARVQSRMRLARTQDVVVLAELSSGVIRIATTPVKVTIGGCAS